MNTARWIPTGLMSSLLLISVSSRVEGEEKTKSTTPEKKSVVTKLLALDVKATHGKKVWIDAKILYVIPGESHVTMHIEDELGKKHKVPVDFPGSKKATLRALQKSKGMHLRLQVSRKDFTWNDGYKRIGKGRYRSYKRAGLKVWRMARKR